MKRLKFALFTAIISIFLANASFAQSSGSVAGQVVDSLGAVVVGATVTAVSPDGKEKQAITNARGEYVISGLVPGTYTVRAIATNFSLYENTEVTVSAGERTELIPVLTVGGVEESVDVGGDNGVSNDPENNAGATVIKGKDLDALPDDPDELEAALQALAGASAGPNGGQIYIDGFTGGRIPPKDSIREVRVNQNPFSAEFDRLGFGRIEILTKPGSDKFRGQAFMNFNDEMLNSRNPFATNRAPSQTKFFGANISGPLQKGKSSYFLDFSNRNIDNNAIINAQILDPLGNITTFAQDIRVPNKRFQIGPRFDYAINDKNTLVLRYNYSKSSVDNQGIGDVSLPSRAYETSSREHEIRATETMIINPKTVNETRFEFSDNLRQQEGDNTIPTINVATAFIGGGAQIGLSYNKTRVYELQNYTTTALGKNSQHSLKFGVRLRHISLEDRSENNFGGTFVFAGVPEVRSPAGCFPVDPPTCTVVSPAITSIEQYRGKVLGLSGAQYNPTQFSITTGEPLADISRTDAGLFISDDWRVSPALLLSFGLRYENQTNISSNNNFAPRFGFAWSPGAGGAKAPKTVFRGGAGIFYERFSENLSLQAERFDGQSQLNLLLDASGGPAAQLLLAQPVFTVNGVTNVPTPQEILAVVPGSSITRVIADDIRTPYTMQAALGVERQLPGRTTLAAFFITSKTSHQLRSRNINAPICPTGLDCNTAPRPDDSIGNIQQFESTGVLKQNQFIINFRTMVSPKYSLFGNYRLGFAKGDSDGAFSYPAYSYDLTGEYGRSSFDTRHSFVIGGNISMPWGVSLNPFITAFSGRPFNITRGIDANRDGVFTERPTFGELQARCSELGLTASFCDIGSNDPFATIPRNYGEGPSFFNVNMRVSKTFGFGGGGEAQAADSGGGRSGGGGGRRGGAAGAMMGGGMRGGRGGSGDGRSPYSLTIGVNFSNLLNTVNLGTPIGSLSSDRFGQSTSTGGGFGGFGGFGGGTGPNRRIELQARFSW